MTKPRKQKSKLLSKVLFLDVLSNPEVRPVLIYVAFIILLGAVVYHWL